MRDPYEVLGVAKTATEDEIKKAFKQGAKKNHPDMNPGDEAAADRFKEISSAYEILSDPVKKAQYDRGGQTPFRRRTNPGWRNSSPPPGFSFEEVMAEFFGGSKLKGRNITFRLEIELKEVFTGCKKYIKLKKRKPCIGCRGEGTTDFKVCTACSGVGFVQTFDPPFEMRHTCKSCNGTGKWDIVKCSDCAGTGLLPGFYESDLEVPIPSGIESGAQLRFQGQGEEPVRSNGIAGDVMVFVLVKDHPIFTREGANLNVEIPISYTQLALGAEIDIPTLVDETISVKIPPGSQSHTKFRIKGKGLPSSRGVGDLVATVKIETPKNIDDEYKKALEQLSELERQNVTPRREQWKKKVAEVK